MKYKYFPNREFLHANSKPYHSRGWKEVVFLKALIILGLKWGKFNIWEDPWLDGEEETLSK